MDNIQSSFAAHDVGKLNLASALEIYKYRDRDGGRDRDKDID